jgi:Mrp family chromosome partitioning ATPase
VLRDAADGAVQAGVFIHVDPSQGFPFDLTNGLPGAEELDDLGLEQADEAFGKSVVVEIPDAADRGIAEQIPLAVRSRIMVITGGPGVGKTTIVTSILRIVAAKGV